MISQWSALNQKKKDGICCMTSHGIGVKGDDHCNYTKNGKRRAKTVSFTSYRYGKRLIQSFFQTYKVEERKYQDKSLDFINKFCYSDMNAIS